MAVTPTIKRQYQARKPVCKNIMKLKILLILMMISAFSADAFSQRKAVSAAEATGTFSTGKDGNEVKLLPLGKGKLKVEFSLIYIRTMDNGEPMAYTGEPSGIAEIKADTAVLDLSQDDRTCKITIKFVRPGLIDVTEGDDCAGIVGGMNVTSFGTYKRTKTTKPKFSF